MVLGHRAELTPSLRQCKLIKEYASRRGALGLAEGSVDQMFVVANDQDNTLRAYRAGSRDPLEMPSGNLNKFLNLNPANDDDDKADFEGATWLNGKAYWIGSHSRSGKGDS